MLEQIESLLTLGVSLLGAVTAVLTALAHLRRLQQPPEDEAALEELEKDIVRLETALHEQQAEIIRLKAQREQS